MRVMQFISFLALYVWHSPAQANEDTYIAAYIKEPISTCEIRNLSSYWSKSTTDTKLAIGQAITEKKDLLPIIQKANKNARAQGVADCEFWDLDFTYEDAEVMGIAWGIDTYEAKMKLAGIAAQQSFSVAKNLVGQHTAKQKNTPPTQPSQTGEDAFSLPNTTGATPKCSPKPMALVVYMKQKFGSVIF